MSVKFNLVLSFVLFSAAVFAAKPTSSDRSFVTVNVDGVTYQCTPGGAGGGNILISGRYKNLAGNDLCPQSLVANVSATGEMTSVTLTFLSPCGGGSSTLTCHGAQCTGEGNTLTVLSRDLYYFLNSNNLGARFQLE